MNYPPPKKTVTNAVSTVATPSTETSHGTKNGCHTRTFSRVVKVSNIKGFVLSVSSKYLDWNVNRKHQTHFRSLMHRLNIPDEPIEGESEYIAKWSRLSKKPDIYSYRLFSRYCGNNPDITPEGICRRTIETILNPIQYRPYYSDKNLYSQYMGDLNMPATYLRRIGGGLILDANYRAVLSADVFTQIPANCERVILKPSVDSNSGRGVKLFERINGSWQSVNSDDRLSREFLLAYRDDFVLQEALQQHPYIAQFCKTSFNTIRIATYRSIADEQTYVIGSIMRIGRDGSFVDNAHAGGAIVGVDTETGEIGKYLFNQYGEKSTTCNGIDFSVNSFQIPSWDKIVSFAQEVAQRNQRNRLLALDIGLDANGLPVLVESNNYGFGYWLFMFSGKTVFGRFTDEIVEYCAANKHRKLYGFTL